MTWIDKEKEEKLRLMKELTESLWSIGHEEYLMNIKEIINEGSKIKGKQDGFTPKEGSNIKLEDNERVIKNINK